MGEWRIILLPALGWVLWALGGTTWKPWRRWVWPLVLTLAYIQAGGSWWSAILAGSAMAAAHHLGYGESSPVWKRILTGLALGLCLLLFGVSWWSGLIVGSWFLLGYALSRKINRLSWKWVEASTGAAQAIACVLTWNA